MTTDIKIRWDLDLFEGDFIFKNNDLTTDEGLANCVLISWFTDQRADDGDIIPNANQDQQFIDKRGWWGDLVSPISENDEIGSKLWLLNRAKTTQENLAKAEEYGNAALQWMIDDGIAKSVKTSAERIKYNNDYILGLQVQITKLDGNEINVSFDPEWFETLSDDYS